MITPEPHPPELAFRLRRQLPPAAEPTLVHGDYRIGNVIFGPRASVRSRLGAAHIGDSIEDLGCSASAPAVRQRRAIAGGIGTREELWRAYEGAGGRKVDRQAVHWWSYSATYAAGIICISQARNYLDETSRARLSPGAALELAAIGRRTAETEWSCSTSQTRGDVMCHSELPGSVIIP
jgi:aminoglycoside phosphotransferase (APT) family kinase protein